MYLPHLEIQYFRNISYEKLSFPDSLTIIVGKNGQGKTSILEAIYLLSHARSFRSANFSEIVQWPLVEGEERPEPCFVEASVISKDGQKSIRYEIQNSRRKVYLNGNPVRSASSFYGQIPVVEFTPDDLFLVKGGPAIRRQFIDKTISLAEKSFIENLVNYQRALRSRNQILKNSLEYPSGPQLSVALQPWNELLIRYGKEIAQHRAEFIARHLQIASSFYWQIAEGHRREEIAFSYRSHFWSDNGACPDEELHRMFSDSLGKDRQLKATSIGIHKDDAEIILNLPSGSQAARRSASQGQSRSMALALKLAAVDYLSREIGEQPILLLDDVESELDESRTSKFYQLISDHQSQIILTATHVSPLVSSILGAPKELKITEGKIDR